ncbi:MAG TPA: PQQ-dependent sugar dehydrogenase [Balneolaceae bacterium]|nr:PQQ-dependent sugar dehydrogenase [Balneolaceae bacterium]
MRLLKLSLFALMILFMGCSRSTSAQKMNYSDNNGGITLPDGFKAVVVADSVGKARHLVVADNGDIYVALSHGHNGHGIAALRDDDGDGVADQVKYFGDLTGTGLDLHDGYLYFSTDTSVVRYKMPENGLTPSSPPETVIEGFPVQHQHAPKAFTFDNSEHIYVNVGAPSNSCQKKDRTKESPGIAPCPLLEKHGGIWQFDAMKTGQTQADGHRYATGLRNVVGLDWKDANNTLYVMQHGRDQLFQSWPEYYTKEEGAELPAEEFFEVQDGDNFGWPYSYYDQHKHKIMLAPEYGGDGQKTIADSKYAGQFERPIMAFPGHWAPDDMIFYTGSQFPSKYKNGAFIAFHGSWNRAPLPQKGYNLVFVPFNGDKPSGDYQVFADGFKGTDTLQSPADAKYRPVGVTMGPDGSLYLTESRHGKIWRIVYTGK